MSVWRTVRVFVSSTFRDMHAERNHLVRVVFPALRERLLRHRVHLVDVDLRWGVTREQAENNQVLGLCLGFVDECRPFSVAILGERYGWVPDQVPPETLARFAWLQAHHARSLTELEILHAAFHTPMRAGHVFFYFRDPAAIETIPRGTRDVYVEADAGRARLLDELKERIRQSGFPVTEYPAHWDPEAFDRVNRSRGELGGLEQFGQRVSEQLWDGIRAELDLNETDAVTPPDPLAEEAEYHERFMESRLRVYVGRRELEARLRQFAVGADTIPCALTGPSGSGKSAALANFVAAVRRLHPDWIAVPHFVGAGPESTTVRQLLRRLCQILATASGDPREVPDTALIPRFDELLRAVPPDRRIVIVIDALNQLDTANHAQDLEWLPTDLPPHVKVIVSCIEDPGRDEPALDALNARPHHLLRVETLTDLERFQIVHDVPMLSAKTLDHTQVAQLLGNPASANPLFLLVALEELRGFGSYDLLRERIDALPRGFDALDRLFAQVIERLEEEFGEPIVRTVLAGLAAARRGLSESELRDLAGGDEVYVVLRQLRPYLQHRGPLLDFYHRNLFKAVRQRYLATDDTRRAAHARLAAFFDQQSYGPLDDLNRRKVDELPWQRLQAEQWDAIDQLFTDPAFLEAKAEAGLAFDLAADFHATLHRYPAVRPMARTLRLFNEALLRDLPFIARHPTALFQCFWNNCWWYDSPQAAGFYPVPDGGWRDTPPWERHAPPISARLEAWRDGRGPRARRRPWLRALRPPAVHLGTGQLAQLTGPENDKDAHFSGLAFVPGTNRLLAASSRKNADGWTTRIMGWDADSGEPMPEFRPGPGRNDFLSLAIDGEYVSVAHTRGHSRLWWHIPSREFIGSEPRVTIPTEPEYIVSPDGKWVAVRRSGYANNGYLGELALIDALTGTELKVLYTSPSISPPRVVAWLPDSRRLLMGGLDAIHVFDVVAGTVLRELRYDREVMWLGVSADGSRVLGASMWMIRLWDMSSFEPLREIEAKAHYVAWSPDGRRVATHGVDENVITLWDLEHAERRRHLGPRIGGLAMSPDGLMLAGGAGNDIVLNDFESGRQAVSLAPKRRTRKQAEEDSLAVGRPAFSPDGTRLAAVLSDSTIRLWDLVSGEERCLVDGTQLPDRARPGTSARGGLAEARSLTFSPDGRWLATGLWTGSAPCDVLLVEVATGALKILSGHQKAVNDVRFSPDSSVVVSASLDGTVRLWEVETGELQWNIPVADDGWPVVQRLWFTADGGGLIFVLSGGDHDGTVWVWDLLTQKLEEVADADDPQVLAYGAAAHRFRGLVQKRRLVEPKVIVKVKDEFIIKDNHSGTRIAWAPCYFGESHLPYFHTHPSGRMWAGPADVLRLEDPPFD